MIDDSDELPLLELPDPEVRELLGLFDVPSFARRGQEVEQGLDVLHARCRRERMERLDMVHLRLRQWAAAAAGPDDCHGVFTGSIAGLWAETGAEPPAWATEPAPLRRRQAIARSLVASLERFNRRWSAFLADLDLDFFNQIIDRYNQFYLLEKECYLGSARLAARHFVPRERLTREGLLAEYPFLRVPVLAP